MISCFWCFIWTNYYCLIEIHLFQRSVFSIFIYISIVMAPLNLNNQKHLQLIDIIKKYIYI